MAFTAGDIVSMTLTAGLNASGLLGPLVQEQPPKFGVVVVVNAGPTLDVLWQDGRLDGVASSTDIPAAALDLIGAPDTGAVTALQGFVVKTNPAVASQAESPEYQGVAVTLYTRDNAAAGSPTNTLCLMRTNAGLYRELLSATLIPVPGR